MLAALRSMVQSRSRECIPSRDLSLVQAFQHAEAAIVTGEVEQMRESVGTLTHFVSSGR
jgi:hypothetical protein